jgi:hypothetical protein
MPDTLDPDERFSLPMEPNEALKRLLDGAGTDEVLDEPEDEEPESS